MAIGKREQMLAYVIGGLLGAWAVGNLVFMPFHRRLTVLGHDVVLQEARLKKGLALMEHSDQIDKEYGKYDTFFSLQGISDEGAVAAFLKELEKVGRSSGFSIIDVKPSKEPAKGKGTRQYEIDIKAESDMGDLVKFLYALYNSSLLFGVERLVLVPKGESASVLSVSMTLVGVVFS